MNIKRIHHVAYRCNDARETVEFYQRVLGMDFQLAIAEDQVPSTKEPDPYMHVFMDAGNRNVLAFFEVPNSPPMQKDPNTPEWVQHIAFEVENMWLKSFFYGVSTFTGLSRLHDHQHYVSQVLLGWWMAFLSVNVTTWTEARSKWSFSAIPTSSGGVLAVNLAL